MDIEEIRSRLVNLLDEAGSDYKASKLIESECWGHAPSPSTLNRLRHGQGKPAMIYMTAKIL